MSDVSLLLRRTGFGTTGAEIEAATRRGYEATVDALVHPGADPGATATPPPDLSGEPARPPAPDDKDARRAYARQLRSRSAALTLWWLDRMVRVRHPLVERLTFTWHGHWATSIQKVRSPAMMLRQNQTLRSLGRGDFRELARAMVRDPALLVWLDGQKNKKGKPNENLARELMELFTLGVGHYSETDVREAARALTGWRVDRTHATAAPLARHHDDGSKTVLGVTGELDDRSLVDLLTARPESAAFVAARLWSRHGSAALPPDTLRRLVAAYGPGRDVTALLRAMFLEPAFRADRSSLVASPVEYVAGVFRALDVAVPRDGRAGRALLGTLDALGQVPFPGRRGDGPHRRPRRGRRQRGPARSGRVPARRRRLDRPHAGRAQGRGRRPRAAGHPRPGQPRIPGPVSTPRPTDPTPRPPHYRGRQWWTR